MLKSFIANIISRLPARRKVQLVNLAWRHLAEASYYRLAKGGFSPSGIIDIGAYHGDWARLIAKIYPQVPILMIEALAEKKTYLDKVKSDLHEATYELCLLGNEEKSDVVFNVMGMGSSLYSERSNVPRSKRALRMHTLDNVVGRHTELKEPLFLKLDVQGAELAVLTGGLKTLDLAEVVQLEIALMNYNEGAPEANAVLNYMSDRQFALFDVCGFQMPKPPLLVQIDVLFARRGSRLRRDYFTF